MRVVGLPVHLWSWKVFKRIGDACGGFLTVNENTAFLSELFCARILVRLGDTIPSKIVVAIGGGGCGFEKGR